MKRKMKTEALLLAGILCLGMNVSAFAADFTDGNELAVEKNVFESDEEAPELEFEAGELVENGADAGFLAEGEVPETVTLDGIEYKYLPETDSYKLVKGVNRKGVDIPKEINGKPITVIGENAFLNCTDLRGVRVAGSVIVEEGAFSNCPRLSEVNIWNFTGRPQFAVGAFDSDSKVIVTSIGGPSKADEAGIPHIDLEDSLIHYNSQGNLCYIDWDKWYVQDFDDSSSDVIVEKGADIIGRRSFYGCSKLQEVVIANGPVSIETKAFSDCKNLKKIIIPATVKEISSDAFEGADKVVIYAPKGSYALSFAKKNGIKYKVSDMERMPRPVLKYERNKNSNRFVNLEWSSVPYAEGYQLYRFNSDRRKYELIGTTRNLNKLRTSEEIDPEKTEYFKVRAFSDSAIYTEKYGLSSMKVTIKPVPDKVKIRTVLAKYPNKLGIYWRQQEGADGYLIYRSETEPYKGYQKIKYITNGSTAKYMDTGVKKGKTYYYRVRAYRTIGGERGYGPLSDPYEVKCK